MASSKTVPRCDESELRAWLGELGLEVSGLVPMAGDVSVRRYFRVDLGGGESVVLACYPDEVLGDCERFVRTTELLSLAGLPVPEVLESDAERGLALVEDLGERTLYELPGLPEETLVAYFAHAAELVRRIGDVPPTAVASLNPPLDGALLQSELQKTWELFLRPRELTGSSTFESRLATALDTLCERLAQGAYAPCHRDFMVRNLIPVGPPPGLAVIDHQGLRLGPLLYDLASLFNDSVFLPQEAELDLLNRHLTSPQEWSAYHRASAQRCLKAVGTYEAFAQGGDDRHAPLIPPTLRRAARHLAHVPEAAGLASDLDALWDLLD